MLNYAYQMGMDLTWAAPYIKVSSVPDINLYLHRIHYRLNLSCHVCAGETVSMTTSKTFLNPGYIVHSILMTQSEVESLKKFVQASDEWHLNLCLHGSVTVNN